GSEEEAIAHPTLNDALGISPDRRRIVDVLLQVVRYGDGIPAVLGRLRRRSIAAAVRSDGRRAFRSTRRVLLLRVGPRPPPERAEELDCARARALDLAREGAEECFAIRTDPGCGPHRAAHLLQERLEPRLHALRMVAPGWQYGPVCTQERHLHPRRFVLDEEHYARGKPRSVGRTPRRARLRRCAGTVTLFLTLGSDDSTRSTRCPAWR